jgi:hypothetical protein
VLSAAEKTAVDTNYVYAGLPLLVGQGLVGVLHVAVRQHEPSDTSDESISNGSGGQRSADLVRALQDPQALKQLAVSVSMALAGAGRLSQLSHLAAGLGHLHDSATLTELVYGLSRCG